MSEVAAPLSPAMVRFGTDYAEQRAAEGRCYRDAELRILPYLTLGPLARQWKVRARTYDAFLGHVIRPRAAAAKRPLNVLDLGAGNGWLCYRLAAYGHHCTAIDIRDDDIDGLAAGDELARERPFRRLAASFEALPLPSSSIDVAAFNAAIHYATDLARVLAEAARVVASGGVIAILDSPFYRREEDGAAMVAEKHATAHQRFGRRAESLLALPFIEFLTRERLDQSSATLDLRWTRQRVRYPLWYEARPLLARFCGTRSPSRFDLWTAQVP